MTNSFQPASSSDSAPSRRVVVLGASNVARSFPTLADTICRRWPGPLQIHAAHGHGRSYGQWSRFFMRKLPGIRDCGLWPALAASPADETYALLTDVGNDVLYEVPVEKIVGWLERCLDELIAANAHTVVMGLPIDNFPSLSVARFRLFRSLFMPGCSLSLSETIRRAERLDQHLFALANERKIKFFRPRPEWYGFDPIHIRMRWYRRVWQGVTDHWPTELSAVHSSRLDWRKRLALRACLPENVEFFGKNRCYQQPCLRLKYDTSISFY